MEDTTPTMIRDMIWGEAPAQADEPGLHAVSTAIIDAPLPERAPGPIGDSLSDPGPNPHSKLFCLRDLLRQELSGAKPVRISRKETPLRASRAKITDQITDQIDVQLDAIIDATGRGEPMRRQPSVVDLIEQADQLCKQQRQRERQLSWSLAGGVALGVVLVISLLLVFGPSSSSVTEQAKGNQAKGSNIAATSVQQQGETVSAEKPVPREKGSEGASHEGVTDLSAVASTSSLFEAPAPSPRGAGARLPTASSSEPKARRAKSKVSRRKHRKRRRWAHAQKRRRARRRARLSAGWTRRRGLRPAGRVAMLSRRKLDRQLLVNPYP